MPRSRKESLSPARSPRPRTRLPEKEGVSPVRRLKRASSMDRGQFRKRGRGKVSDGPGFPPLPIGRGREQKSRSTVLRRTESSRAFCPFVPTGVHLPLRPIVKAKATKPLHRPRPVQMQKAVPTDCRHGGPEKPPLKRTLTFCNTRQRLHRVRPSPTWGAGLRACGLLPSIRVIPEPRNPNINLKISGLSIFQNHVVFVVDLRGSPWFEPTSPRSVQTSIPNPK